MRFYFIYFFDWTQLLSQNPPYFFFFYIANDPNFKTPKKQKAEPFCSSWSSFTFWTAFMEIVCGGGGSLSPTPSIHCCSRVQHASPLCTCSPCEPLVTTTLKNSRIILTDLLLFRRNMNTREAPWFRCLVLGGEAAAAAAAMVRPLLTKRQNWGLVMRNVEFEWGRQAGGGDNVTELRSRAGMACEYSAVHLRIWLWPVTSEQKKTCFYWNNNEMRILIHK